jgi:hypothetical protein
MHALEHRYLTLLSCHAWPLALSALSIRTDTYGAELVYVSCGAPKLCTT